MSKVYIYVVDRDFGFAPNPFHSYCTLATCKPKIRKKAQVGDWVIGLGGLRLRATGRCIYAMCITEKLTFNEYWSDPRFLDKRPVRNGSQKMMVGDNIYHSNPTGDPIGNKWCQEDSHHSNADGSINESNVQNDTSSDNVLVSENFVYFGRKAYPVPSELLASIGYENARGYRLFKDKSACTVIEWLETSIATMRNDVIEDPFDFEHSGKRYSQRTNRIE